MDIENRLKEKFREIDEKDPIEFWPVAALAVAVGLGFWLRYRPVQGMRYLQALDPYMIYRMSQHVALDGSLPALDFMRYFPYATPTYNLQLGNIVFPALLYYLGPFLFLDYLTWAQISPAVWGAGSVALAYFLGREIWDRYAGAASAFMLAVIAGGMHRTSAGFFEKEPVGTFFMMSSLYLFVSAWSRRSRLRGIGSGLSLAFFTISWGGSSMLWLLYPLVAGSVAFIDEDIEGLVAAYTPTVLLGGLVASALNPSKFWFTSALFVANLGVVGVIWTRYLAAELELVEDYQLPYVVPGVSVFGLAMALLSPLYSDWLADKVMRAMSMAVQSGTGNVIAGTVAENQPAGIGQLVGQLGAARAAGLNPFLGIAANIAGSWPLAFIGVAMMATSVAAMLGRKYGLWGDTLEANDYLKLFAAVFLAWLISFAFFFQDSVIFATAPATLTAVAGLIGAYSFEMVDDVAVEYSWQAVLPLAWTVTNIISAVSKSRLIFLATFPVAIAAGYALSRAFVALKEYDYSSIDPENSRQIKGAVLAAVMVPVLLTNAASGFQASESLGGSPNQAWMESLDWMEENTEPGAVLMSWWDYGYWFESIGRRAAPADGGNNRYYTSEQHGKVNFPLADYLTGKTDGEELFERHSVDYFVLDSTMIGKYQAVSQISARNNSFFWSMRTLGTNQPLPQQLQDDGTATFSSNRLGISVFTPISEEGRIDEAPTVETPLGRGKVSCVLSDEGRRDFDVNESAQVPQLYFHQPSSRTDTVEVCVAEHPFRSFERGFAGGSSQLVLVPEPIADSNLVQLYLMNGANLDYAEPVEGASNGFVRVWNVTR